MAEYIEREALIADIEKRYCRTCEAEGKDYNHVCCRACWVDDMRIEIEDAPAADAAPVVHGRWIDTGFFNSYKSPIYECSACHNEVYDHYIDCHKYCLHCGARMDGERKDGEG